MANIKKKERKRKKLWCSHTKLELISTISLVVVKSNWLHYTPIVTWSLTVTGYLSQSVVLIRPLSGWGLDPVYTDGRRHSLSECSRAGRGTQKSSMIIQFLRTLRGWERTLYDPPLCRSPPFLRCILLSLPFCISFPRLSFWSMLIGLEHVGWVPVRRAHPAGPLDCSGA